MPEIQLTDMERKVLSYLSRGASKDTAADRMSRFFNVSSNEIMGVVISLRKQNLVIESKGVGVAGVVAYTTNPLKVKSSMLDQSVIALLKESEMGGRAAGFKKKTFTADQNTGEIRDPNAPRRVTNTAGPIEKKKPSVDLGFDIE